MDNYVYGIDARDVWVFDGQNFTGLGNQRVKNWLFDQINPTYYNMVYMQVNTAKNQIEIYYPDSTAISGIPNKMLSYRYDIDCWNAPRVVSNAISACESPIYVSGAPKFSSRCVTYVDEVDNIIIQKDQGYAYYNNSPIASTFRRDDIKFLPNYSGKLMMHRVLPEAVNLGATPFTSTYNQSIIPSTGNLTVQVLGRESVGQAPVQDTSGTITLNTNYPWVQIDQNAHRLNDVVLTNVSSNNVWMCTALTFQYTQVEDDR
jgi:hypothetical protein